MNQPPHTTPKDWRFNTILKGLVINTLHYGPTWQASKSLQFAALPSMHPILLSMVMAVVFVRVDWRTTNNSSGWAPSRLWWGPARHGPLTGRSSRGCSAHIVTPILKLYDDFIIYQCLFYVFIVFRSFPVMVDASVHARSSWWLRYSRY